MPSVAGLKPAQGRFVNVDSKRPNESGAECIADDDGVEGIDVVAGNVTGPVAGIFSAPVTSSSRTWEEGAQELLQQRESTPAGMADLANARHF